MQILLRKVLTFFFFFRLISSAFKSGLLRHPKGSTSKWLDSFQECSPKSILWVLNEWLEQHKFMGFIIRKDVSGLAFCINGEPYWGIKPVASLQATAEWKDWRLDLKHFTRKRIRPGSRDSSDVFDLLHFLLLACCSCDIWCLNSASKCRFLGAVLWLGREVGIWNKCSAFNHSPGLQCRLSTLADLDKGTWYF